MKKIIIMMIGLFLSFHSYSQQVTWQCTNVIVDNPSAFMSVWNDFGGHFKKEGNRLAPRKIPTQRGPLARFHGTVLSLLYCTETPVFSPSKSGTATAKSKPLSPPVVSFSRGSTIAPTRCAVP